MTATTISDTDRREVARRLRGIKDTREGCGHDLCCDLWSAVFGSDYRCTDLCDECEVAVLNSLADLIEPTCDRDALLAPAEEMVEAFRLGAFTGEGLDAKWCRELHDKYARRIREALGVSDA